MHGFLARVNVSSLLGEHQRYRMLVLHVQIHSHNSPQPQLCSGYQVRFVGTSFRSSRANTRHLSVNLPSSYMNMDGSASL